MERLQRKVAFDAPIKVVQFGEGNFLRAFIDWMIDQLNEKAAFNGAVQIVQPLEQGMGELINEQGGLYTLLLRGVCDGKVNETRRQISCVRGCLNPYREWESVAEVFELPSLRFCLSNATEAGIEYRPEELILGATPKTFPAKLTALLYRRFQKNLPGLIFLPCELIERNGGKLRECMLQYIQDWKLGEDFRRYVEQENTFCSTLVDRIVAGYPRAEAEKLCAELGYEDKLLDCGEPFHFFVIEGPKFIEEELPLAKIGLNVIVVDDQTPYRTRKVRFLNGAHTASVLAAFMAGFDYVDEMVGDPLFNRYLRQLLFAEIFPTIQLPDAEKQAFAEAVLERFANPFAFHRLLSISLNSISKWKVRCLPSLLDYVKITGKLPAALSFSLAALLLFEENVAGVGVNRVDRFEVKDDPEKVAAFAELWKCCGNDLPELARRALSKVDYWGMDLNTVPGLTERTAANLQLIRQQGVRQAVREVLK